MVPELEPDEMHHLARVRRARPGESIEILNGRGAVAVCHVASVDRRKVDLELDKVTLMPPPALKRHLLVALPKGKTFSSILQKSVELGVTEITPLMTEFSEVPPTRAEKKSDRWESVLIEAVKQSGNPWIPRLNEALPLSDCLAGLPESSLRICAALQPGAVPLWEVLHEDFPKSGCIEVFVGPEGDFSANEYAGLAQAGCRFVTLGPLVLRVETATSLVMGAIHLLDSATGPDAIG